MSRLLIAVIVGLVVLNVSACRVAQTAQVSNYLPLDTPEAPVYNAFWALKQGDIDKAREQYTDVIRAAIDRGNSGATFYTPSDSRKTDDLVILTTRPSFNRDPDRMFVKFRQVGYRYSLPWYNREGEVLVIHTEDGWKIASIELFESSGLPLLGF